MSPEFELLLSLAQTPPGEKSEVRARTLAEQDINWEAFVELAESHCLGSFLGWRLRETSLPVPDAVRDHFKTRLLANTGRQMFLSAELAKIVGLFRSEGVETLAFKGPVLAVQLYSEACLREYEDLDLLVRPSDVPAAKRLLERLGYRTEVDTEHPERAPVTRYSKELWFQAEDGRAVDLHWGLHADLFPSPVSEDAVWNRAASTVFSGVEVATLCRDDLFLYLCFHGGKHGWECLSWLVDLARLIEISPDLDWRWILEQARAARCERMVMLGLHLADGLLGARIPEELMAQAEADPRVRWLAQAVVEDLSARTRWLCRLLESPSDRIRHLLGITLTPAVADWRIIQLPPSLHFLYYPFRPLRLFAKYAARSLQLLLAREATTPSCEPPFGRSQQPSAAKPRVTLS